MINFKISANKAQTDGAEQSGEASAQQDVIDNPYLRPGKLPKNKISGTNISGPVKREAVDI